MSKIKTTFNRHGDFLKYLFAITLLLLILRLFDVDKNNLYFMFLFGKLQSGRADLLSTGTFFLNKIFEILFLSAKFEKLFTMLAYIISRRTDLRKKIFKKTFFVSAIDSLSASCFLFAEITIFSDGFKLENIYLFAIHFLSLMILQNLICILFLHKMSSTGVRAVIIMLGLAFCIAIPSRLFHMIANSLNLILISFFIFCLLAMILNIYIFGNFDCIGKEKNK